jgi:hypothetical protein
MIGSLEDVHISKKRKIIQNEPILEVLNIHGLLELVYSFLMNPIDRYGMNNEHVWISLRQVCKMGKIWSNRLVKLLYLDINSTKKLDAWTVIVPDLQHLRFNCMNTNNWFPSTISLFNLRFMIFKRIATLIPNDILYWNCPKLEHLELVNYIATESAVSTISLAFPLLTYFHCSIADQEFTITGFPNLIDFSFCAHGTIRLYIVNMPRLETCEFEDGSLDLLQFKNVPNLQHITSSLGRIASVNAVVFSEMTRAPSNDDIRGTTLSDAIPFLETFYLPFNQDLEIISGVNWKNVKSIALTSGNIWEQIWFQLESIEVLSINDIFPDVWPIMKHLHTLSCSLSNSIRLKNLLCSRHSLTSLNLHWNFDSSFDMADLLCFPNISTLCLYGSGNYNHLDSVVSMPILRDLQISMHITKSEEMILREWQKSVPSRSLKAYFLK